MKITKTQLKQIIKEELEVIFEEKRGSQDFEGTYGVDSQSGRQMGNLPGQSGNTYQRRTNRPSRGFGTGEIHFPEALAYFNKKAQKIAKLMARMKLLTGARGQRQMREEWETMIGGLSDIAKTIGARDPLETLYSERAKIVQQYKKMDVDQRSKLEVENEKAASVEVWRLIGFMVDKELHDAQWYKKKFFDKLLDANAEIQNPANWKPTGKFRTEL
jgi:hypothetical protein